MKLGEGGGCQADDGEDDEESHLLLLPEVLTKLARIFSEIRFYTFRPGPKYGSKLIRKLNKENKKFSSGRGLYGTQCISYFTTFLPSST